jgi:hypothetical protein
MADTTIARLFTHGRSQAVSLPKESRVVAEGSQGFGALRAGRFQS